jgi:hypothetical protein
MRANRRAADLAPGFLGAVTTIGMALVLCLGAVAVAFLLARVRHADTAAVAAGIAAHLAGIDVVGALVLSFMVLGAFFCGGYVAARLIGPDGRGQAVTVWIWAVLAPLGLAAIAIGCWGGVGAVAGVLGRDPAAAWLGICLAVIGLLGALLGGETGQGASRRLPPPDPGLRYADGDERRDPSWTDPVPARIPHAIR